MEIHDMPEKYTYLFHFVKKDDYNRVLKGRPWAIQGALLNLQHWDDFMILREVSFSWCAFWVQFHDLPHVAFGSENVVKLGNAVEQTMLYESPRLQDRLSRTIGHDSHNCKFQADLNEDETEDTRPGNELGTAHVKTIEDALVIHDQT
ncbi:hypothetical protein K1719_028033 [Acacia pycnantha]|nr:hypothetical protein K1719_028033 [Acacia pycnantha]